ncbi:hypothetical protein [Chitinophaga ginsengisoli]|uniref:Uncharacterized protein n=1 Tax=Chitinophaga ginsengisoli TaxID=363837 RepID=A0A2P8GD86_9BACT|nr:hypothetical protein [Chitinophaga ginsengisoli]PSL31916.1 hypothetical protein CLV42_104215 [Chitinophaga ginsengisoli]
MEHNTVENKNDFTGSWVSSSRFLFYVTIFCILSFVLGGCYNLFKHRYQGKPEVVVPDNTLYNPKYK